MAEATYIRQYQPDTLALMSGVESAVNEANRMATANSARSSMYAREQREWQEQQNAKAMQFNASEAAKSRDWQEYMSNTAHQREIADLKAAGLNPVLSAMGGNGAAVTSGATASGVTSAGAKGEVDTSANNAIVNLLGSMLSYMGNLQVSSTSAIASMANAERSAAATELVGALSASATRYSAEKHYDASKYAADRSKYGVLDKGLDVLIDLIKGDPTTDSGKGVFNFLDRIAKDRQSWQNEVGDPNDEYADIADIFPGLRKFKVFNRDYSDAAMLKFRRFLNGR